MSLMNAQDVVDYGSLLDNHPELLSLAIGKRRLKVSRWVSQRLHDRVSYGPFAGMHMPWDSSWDPGARASMLLGLYEQEVLEKLVDRLGAVDLLVDVGAADGYYAVGSLFSKRVGHALCFEDSERGRTMIARTAQLNWVSDHLTIEGRADESFVDVIKRLKQDRKLRRAPLILMDIEGGEFELIKPAVLEDLRDTSWIIELHPFAVVDGDARLRSLLAFAQKTHPVELLGTTARDLSKFPELQPLSDVDRWLLVVEGRPCSMQWLVLDPL